MPTYTWKHQVTEEYLEVQATITNRNIPPDESGLWKRIMEAPMVMQAAYPDGVRKDMTDFKKIAKLQQAAAELPKNDPTRNEIGKEIKDRKKI